MQAITMHWRQNTAVALTAMLTLCGCQPQKPVPPVVSGGDARLGKALLAQFQCGACHRIPDVEAARGQLGPPLDAFARRSYIAGRWPNDQATLVRWITEPDAMQPGTVMPDMGVSADDARHMAAYLYSLK